MSLEALDSLLEWGQQNHVKIPQNVEFVYDELRGIHCKSKDMVTDVLKFELPHNVILTGVLAEKVFGTNNTTWCKFLLAKLMFDKDATLCDGTDLTEKFNPYLNALPKVVNSPLVWNPRELELLRNTNLGNSIRGKLKSIYKEWYDVVSNMTNKKFFEVETISHDISCYENFEHISSERMYDDILSNTANKSPAVWYSFSAFLWSHLIFTSRAFPEYIINPECDPFSVMLLPIVDLLNHDYQAKAEWSSNEDRSFCYKNLNENLKAGDEVLNNYGAKGNEELLSGYGFVLENNICDSLLLKLKLPDDTIRDILDYEPDIELLTIDDYTTFAFETEMAQKANATNKKTVENFSDGIIYLINVQNPRATVLKLLKLFSYLKKCSGKESHKDLRARFDGLHTLRGAIEQNLSAMKSEPVFTENYREKYDLNEYRLYCASEYRKGQEQVLKNTISEIRAIEKEWLKENKHSLLSINKILKNDTQFAENELSSLFQGIDQEDVAFESTFDLLIIWIVAKAKYASFPSKYEWVGKQFNELHRVIGDAIDIDVQNDASAFYEEFFTSKSEAILPPVTLDEIQRAFMFVKYNCFTRVSSDETILVKK
ncbi:hypothetical protein KAFR_0K00290 [Kazachstania africana CBS 2517]|uniref:SET domain-containing protein n=1 Tax=Kazachstania africana (strain ATCC 22294 / BCRC 22015 / CBS 2517 / CECT 1963 / NBRC 1671 / NRRL Y-8276) TaxID=1071382 RepID=H2B184_KAZAF|nr:hypothetical protein KAFR_0K00290 [Kazachstania africana CBS 2517]CCF60384.1 hypothetical protein KAFR_0K00290 [Kazachstania africana CBS 2517]